MGKYKDEILELINSPDYRPLIKRDLYKVFDIAEDDQQEKEEFDADLDELYREGKIYKTPKGKYCPPELLNIFTGVLEKNEKGFGFLLMKDKGREDIFIPRDKMNGAMHQDTVAVKITRKRGESGRDEGQVVEILKREKNVFVGRFEKSRHFGFVVVDDRRFSDDIYVKNEDSAGARNGDKVIVEITQWPRGGRSAEGRIIEILGRAGEKGVDEISILRSYGFNENFSAEAEEEAGKIRQFVSEEDLAGRRDLRDWKIFTIDGADTKDIDDAVSIEKLDNGHYLLGVHIADVSHYVKEGTALDRDAYERATSVYLPGMVAPMLPRALSNGICSLNPGVDRLALSVLMEIDSMGNVVNHDIFKSVIRSREQMTYENLYKILEEDDQGLKERYRDLLEDFYLMKELALILRQKRKARGALDFEIPEAKVILDARGKAAAIIKYEITIANRIIEEFMLVCNETVSEHFYWLEVPFMYRIHEEPDSEKISNFADFARVLGYRLKGQKKVHPKALQELIDKVRGKKEERVINTILLRSLQKARYSEKSSIHFGLAAQYYCHFTSPIRRYPDLTIHRIISEVLAGTLDDQKKERYQKSMKEADQHCSERERAAEMAERDAVKIKMAEYMASRIGERFKGVISGITSFGMFVELDNLVEGLVRVSSMDDDYYIFDEKNYSFIGERTGKIYKIGDEVEIIVANADLASRTIEFELVLGYNE